ncbi:MAG: hypothetical protein K5854_09580 [Prevotella sp.]|nr:hypothetical protein [Prevotella sp.]
MTVAELIKKYNIKKAYTPLFGYVRVEVRNGNYPIRAEANECNDWTFTEEGAYVNGMGECLIFLDEDHTPITEENCEKMFGKKHKEFKPFDKVLTLQDDIWCADFYSHYNDSIKCHETMDVYIPDNEIVPYEGHESWIGKTWEECHE